MATGTFTFNNDYGYSEQIENPEEYQTYNIVIGNGLVDNQTSATVTLYSEPDCRGNFDYLHSRSSKYLSEAWRSFRFTS
ncbi:hypothetical protein [Nocardia sp. NPDC057440]|uniref:hypothetical protein n=1 Tax=Nocardia sp. NPDC057440 TaxID=3346134 RepID=UPI003671E87F